MRILHVLDHSLPLHSGYTFRTLAILREQRALGWQTFHVTSPKHPATEEKETVEGWEFARTVLAPSAADAVPGVRLLREMHALTRRLDALISRLRPHVIHAHSPVLNALPALHAGRRHRIPVVYEVRAFWEDAAVDHGTAREWGPRYRLTRALETFALRRVAHVTTICEGLRDEIAARGIPRERITVVPNAVNVADFRFGVDPDVALKRSLGLDGCIVIGFIGSFYAYEGLDLLLKAFPRVLEDLPQARVMLVGGGPQEPLLKSLAATLGIQDKIFFIGRVRHQEVQHYYSIVDVLAYPRHSMRLTDLVTPLKPLEAMAQGRLVLASDVGGHRELIRDGETGVLFRAGDAEALAQSIVRLLPQRERCAQLREQGRRFVERERTWPAAVARYRDVFGRLAPGAS